MKRPHPHYERNSTCLLSLSECLSRDNRNCVVAKNDILNIN